MKDCLVEVVGRRENLTRHPLFIRVFYGIFVLVEKRKYADIRESNILAVSKRRKKLRKMAVDLLGGKCMICGYCRDIKALDFHHIDETTKKFGLFDRGMTRSWVKIKEEVLKCALLCANCHRELHSGSISLADNHICLVK